MNTNASCRPRKPVIEKYNGGQLEWVLPHFTWQIPTNPTEKLAGPGYNCVTPLEELRGPAWSSLRLCIGSSSHYISAPQLFWHSAWKATLSLCVGSSGFVLRLCGPRLAQRQLSWLLCCLHKLLSTSVYVFPNYHCPSVVKSSQSISLLRTYHLRKSISSISLCVFSNWPQASIYTFPVEKSMTKIKSLINC